MDPRLRQQKETLKVIVTEVLDDGKFYIQTVGDHRIAFIQQQFSSLEVNDPSETLDAEDHPSKSLEGEGEALSETFEVKDPSENLEAEVPLDTLEVKDPSESL